MRRQERIVLCLVLIVALLLKEEVYAFFFRNSTQFKTEEMICEIRNQELERNYQELVTSYGYEEEISYPTEKSKVLFRDLYDLKHTITIYKGSEENIAEKNLVVNQYGLVGIVSKVSKHSSEVMLLQNKDLNLSVKIGKTYGILKYENNRLVVKGIDNKKEVQVNDAIVTSDLSIYPEDIYIGKVGSIELDSYGIEQILVVDSEVKLDEIKYVSVITALRG